jgi:hypothetical protein
MTEELTFGDDTVAQIIHDLCQKILNTPPKEAIRIMVELKNIEPPRSWYRQW